MLLFQGQDEIKPFFEFILNYSYAEVFPVLHAPVAFLNAQLSQVQIQANGSFLRQKQGSEGEKLFYLDLVGPLFPTSLIQLCQTLKRTQNSEFSISLKTAKDTSNFNFEVISPINENSFFQHPIKSGTVKKAQVNKEGFSLLFTNI